MRPLNGTTVTGGTAVDSTVVVNDVSCSVWPGGVCVAIEDSVVIAVGIVVLGLVEEGVVRTVVCSVALQRESKSNSATVVLPSSHIAEETASFVNVGPLRSRENPSSSQPQSSKLPGNSRKRGIHELEAWCAVIAEFC